MVSRLVLQRFTAALTVAASTLELISLYNKLLGNLE